MSLNLPPNTRAVLFDLDGVIIDSLKLDEILCERELTRLFGPEVKISRDFIRSIFALATQDFARLVLEKVAKDYDYPNALDHEEEFHEIYCKARESEKFPFTPNIHAVFNQLKEQNIPKALVSNNSTSALEAILSNQELTNEFPIFVGNDLTFNGAPMRKKPHPDPYLIGASRLNLQPEDCVVIEDSLEGSQSGKAAGCYVIGVATGGATFEELQASPNVDAVYKSF